MITDKQLAEWERLAGVASPAPIYSVLRKCLDYGQRANDGTIYDCYSVGPIVEGPADDAPWDEWERDARFAAAAATAVPALIAEVRQLRALLDAPPVAWAVWAANGEDEMQSDDGRVDCLVFFDPGEARDKADEYEGESEDDETRRPVTPCIPLWGKP